MKTNKFITLITIVLASFTISSCVQDDDYTVPNDLGQEESNGVQEILNDIESGDLTLISIVDLKGMYSNSNLLIESNLVVKGYVSSSDETGNYYKEFYMQNDPTSPTAGIGVSIDMVDTYNKYNQGRLIYILLKDLYLGENSSDVITIGGTINGTNLEEIIPNKIDDHLFRTSTTEALEPVVVTPSSVNDSHLGLFVKFENMQFPNSLQGEAYVDENESFDTQRIMKSCEDESTFILETSKFASFKQVPLPLDGKGSILGILTQNFGGSQKVLVLNTNQDVMFNDEFRCDPISPEDFTSIFHEDFQDITPNTDLDITGWTNFAEAGGWVWREKDYQGNGYAEFSAYNSNDVVNKAWLVSPAINLDAQDGEFLFFRSAQHHLDSDDNTLEVFVSTDYDGSDVLAATWEAVSVTLPNQDTSWYDFVDSGAVDLSSYSGNLHVAFKYTGSGTDTDLDGGYQIDDFYILLNE